MHTVRPETEIDRVGGNSGCWFWLVWVLFVALAKANLGSGQCTRKDGGLSLRHLHFSYVPERNRLTTTAMPASALCQVRNATDSNYFGNDCVPNGIGNNHWIDGGSRGARFIRHILRRCRGENQKGGEKHQADTSPPDRVVRACPVSDIAGQRWSDPADR